MYYVVSVRTEADMNGFCSVFEQLLHHEEDLRFFTQILSRLGEDDMAESISEIRRLLLNAGYFSNPTREFHALPADVLKRVSQLGTRILLGERLWNLDSKLAVLPRRDERAALQDSRSGA